MITQIRKLSEKELEPLIEAQMIREAVDESDFEDRLVEYDYDKEQTSKKKALLYD